MVQLGEIMSKRIFGRFISKTFVVAAIGLGMVWTSNASLAQNNAPVILTYNEARVLSDSKAGKNISAQLAVLGGNANKFLTDEVNRIKKEGEELSAKKDDLNQQDYQAQAVKVLQADRQLPALRQIKAQELKQAQDKAITEIINAMIPIMKDIVDEKGATILLERATYSFAAPNTNITDEIIKRLDAKLPSVKVEQVQLLKKVEN